MNRTLSLLLLCLAACAGQSMADAAAPLQAPPAAAPAGTTPPPAPGDAPAPPPTPTDSAAPTPTPADSAAPAPADTPPPPAATPAGDTAPAATPPLPASGPLPEVQDAGLGYPTPAAALEALRQKPGTSVIEQDGWTIVQDPEDAQHLALWSFTPHGHPAHPAMVKRTLYARDGKVWMSMEVQCGGSKRACDTLVREYQALNDGLTSAARERVRQAAQANAAPAGDATPPPTPVAAPPPTPVAATLPVPVATPAPPPTAPPAAPPAGPPPAATPPTASPPPAPAAAPELWTRALDQACPDHHAAWIGPNHYTALLAGFESKLAPATRHKLQALEPAQRPEAYRRLGLLHRFVRYSCAQVQCQAPGQCSPIAAP